MKDKISKNISEKNPSRRKFLKMLGTAAAGLYVIPYLKPSGVFGYGYKHPTSYLAQVAITKTNNTAADNYDPVAVKQKVQYLFDTLGGISDVVKAGDKVAIKINLTGGSSNATSSALKGVPITEAMWTHPAVIQAVGELLIDSGVRATDIYIVDSLWDTGPTAPFGINDSFGYAAVQKALGCNLIDLNNYAPYNAFVDMPVGSKSFNFTSFKMNQILSDVNVYVSIPKLKQHAEAGFTCSLKNQVGIVPKPLYTITTNTSRRQAIHNPTGGSSANYLPQSVCDLNSARPVNLAIVDGIKNAKGGEGAWNPTFTPYESHVLFAGKDPVATDSVGAYLMGLDCEASTLPLPGGGTCDNHLYLLNQIGAGTNQLNKIEVLGDGAGLVTAVRSPNEIKKPTEFKLCSNFPNPFNPSTRIVFYLPKQETVTMKIYNIAGQEVETLIDGNVPAGEHDLNWNATGLSSGVYLCRMQAGKFSGTIKMIYTK